MSSDSDRRYCINIAIMKIFFVNKCQSSKRDANYLSLSIIFNSAKTVLCSTSEARERCLRKSSKPMSHNERTFGVCFTYVLSKYNAIPRIISIWSQKSCQHFSTREKNYQIFTLAYQSLQSSRYELFAFLCNMLIETAPHLVLAKPIDCLKIIRFPVSTEEMSQERKIQL